MLSGGQRQRLAIARALANEPTLLLADEPTGALDSEGGHEVLELFRRLHANGQTILLVTHDREVAEAGDRIVWMRDGRVATEDDAASTAGSWPFSSKSSACAARPSPTAAASPMTPPTTIIPPTCPMTMLRTRSGAAPSAIRRPISLVRWATV